MFIFSNQNPQFWPILESLGFEHFDIFYDHLVYFLVIRFILWHFGIFFYSLLYFPNFGILNQEKSGNLGRISI
jgi:hypothetical protein